MYSFDSINFDFQYGTKFIFVLQWWPPWILIDIKKIHNL